MRDVMTFVLAGGRGERLDPLTRDRAKPAVPFAGHYRIIDFTLSNCMHSGLRRIFILTQYKSLSLEEHVRQGWNVVSPALDEFLETIPPQQRIHTEWYRGTADAIHQNWYCVDRYTGRHRQPDAILILAGDHIYKMDYRTMIEFHREQDADVTVAVLTVHRDEVRGKLGELIVDSDRRVIGFDEKPEEPTGIPDAPELCMASLGIYVFRPEVLQEELEWDAPRDGSAHDFGRDVLPAALDSRKVFAFPFEEGNRNSEVYWRDVGTIEAYWQAHMDLIGVVPRFDLYDNAWPIHTLRRPRPPAKIVRGEGEVPGVSYDSLLSAGSIVSGATVVRSILSPDVIVRAGAQVEDSVLLDRVEIGRGARIRRAILDKDIIVSDGVSIGYDPDADKQRGLLTDGGITVIPKGMLIE